ncbi:MAG: DinB family protein [Chloroflexia bacterium]
MSTTLIPEAPAIAPFIAMIDDAWAAQEAIISQLGPALSGGIDPGGWTARQLLSHLIGAWQRVPIHAGFYLDGDPTTPVAFLVSDPYWISEWQTAPLASFLLSLHAAVEGNKAFVRRLDPAALAETRTTPFGPWTLQKLLEVSYGFHLGQFHLDQLRAFIKPTEA